MRTISLLIAMLLVCGVAYASNTSGASWTTPYSPLTHWLNNNDIDHTHNYSQTSKYKSPLGIGTEVTFWEGAVGSIPYGLGVDATYDFNNGRWGCFGKVDVNLSPIIKGFLKK